jgi:hypothetical protein
MELHLKIIGLILIFIAFVHVIFPKYFQWETDLSSLSLVNRQMMYVHTFFVALMVFLMGILCLTSSKEIVETALGNKISLGFGIFWTIRLFIQFFGYSSKLWKGKRFETIIHILFSILWAYLSVVFLLIFWKFEN